MRIPVPGLEMRQIFRGDRRQRRGERDDRVRFIYLGNLQSAEDQVFHGSPSNIDSDARIAVPLPLPMSNMPRTPVLGLIFPPAARGVPEEGVAMYGERLQFAVTGLGVERMTPAGFDEVMERIPAAAAQLAAAGADAI